MLPDLERGEGCELISTEQYDANELDAQVETFFEADGSGIAETQVEETQIGLAEVNSMEKIGESAVASRPEGKEEEESG
jgi:hypothetical protein